MRSPALWILCLVGLLGWTSSEEAQMQRGGVQPSSARDQAAALQSESAGGRKAVDF